MRKSQNGVTTSSEPSAKRAVTVNGWVRPAGTNRYSGASRRRAVTVPRPGGDPGAEDAVLPGVFRDADAALVGHAAGGLEQQQGVVRVDRVEPAAEDLAGQGGEVPGGVVAEQRQAEAALALEGAVAGAVRAAALPEPAHDVPLGIDRLGRRAAGDGDGVGPGGGGGEGDGERPEGEPAAGHGCVSG